MNAKETSKTVKQILTKEMPKTEFSVRLRNNAIWVTWVNGYAESSVQTAALKGE